MKKILSITVLSIFISLNSYASENNDKEKDYINQWNTVLSLQRVIDNGLIKESIMFFSDKKKEYIKLMINKSENSFINAWKLNENISKKYKKLIFQGKGLFVFENGEWKIDEI